MKKFILSILLLSLFPVLISCGSVSAQGEEFSFTATVISVSDKIEVESDEGQNEFGTYLIVTGNETKYYDKGAKQMQKINLTEGTRIKITYNGQVAKSFPPQVFALEIELI